MLYAKMIRCHRTELISVATLACMGRPWLDLSVRSLIRITKEGRLCARDYPGPVNDDSLESRFGYMDPVPVWDNVVSHAMAGVWRTQGYPRHDLRSMSGGMVREARGRTVS